MNSHTSRLAFALLLAAALAACGDDGATTSTVDPDAAGGKTDLGGDAAAFEGRNDPVASWLRKVTRADGTVDGDYQTVLEGVAAEMGCPPESSRSFVILLSRKEYFPRNMFTVCGDDTVKASKFFMSTQSDDGTLSDVDPRNLKMFAWDADARTYRTYELLPEGEGSMRVSIEPGHCRSCHTGPTDLDNRQMAFVPIMNELVNPWTLWNARPDFDSHLFDEVIDPAVAGAPVYKAMTAEGRLDSAANFERHIREGMSLVTATRIRARRDPADLELSLGLLRPMFCDETLNYVSENHDSGELHASAILDDSIRRLYLSTRPDGWRWAWLNDGKLRMPLPAPGQEPIAVIPTRGEATVQLENALVSRKTLTAQQVLQVRALDWKHPVLSDLRCGLFLDGATRIRAHADAWAPYATNNDLIPALFAEIMTLPDGESRRSLLSEQPDTLYALPTADGTLDSADLDGYTASMDDFGDQLQSWFDELQSSTDRAWLTQERTRRGCGALAHYPSAPEIPGVGSCDP